MTNLIKRTNGEPFATEANAKGARTRMGLTHTHDVIQHGGGWVMSEKQSGAEKVDEPVTLQPGDYIATEGLSEDDYHAVARAFMAAGADAGEYPDGDGYTAERAFGVDYRSNRLFHGRPGTDGDVSALRGRQLTLSQILSATNASGGVEAETSADITAEPTTQQQPMPQQHLADQLEAALLALDNAQQNVDRLRQEYRAAYPKIHGEVVPTEDMTDPANWRAGDVLECIDSDFQWVRESGVNLGKEVTLEENIDRSELEQGGVAVIAKGYKYHMEHQAFRFVRRP